VDHFHCVAKPGLDGRAGHLDSAGFAETRSPDLPLRYFVIGKTWHWKNQEPYIFIENLKQIEKALKSGKLLYKTATPGL
jgi:hypothetical protein